MDIDPIERASRPLPAWIWCVVGNIRTDQPSGEKNPAGQGTRRFSPGTRIYFYPEASDHAIRRQSALALGKQSGQSVLVRSVIGLDYVEKLRVKQVHDGRVIEAMVRGWLSSEIAGSPCVYGKADPHLKTRITSVNFASRIAYLSSLNMDYCIDRLSSVSSISGMGSIHGVRKMNYTFAKCASLTIINLIGFSPSTLTTLAQMFSRCNALATITMSSTWALPSRISGFKYFSTRRLSQAAMGLSTRAAIRTASREPSTIAGRQDI